MVVLLSARLLVALCPFSCLTRLLVRPTSSAVRPGSREFNARRADHVRWAVASVARFPFPWAVCLPQALAAHWLLARRHVVSRICFGVNRGAKGLQSHAWLTCDGQAVIGGQTAEEFAVVAEFPVLTEKE